VTRVLHAVVAGEVGGAERMLVDLASNPGATRAEHAVALVTPSDSLRRMLSEAGLRVHDRGPAREGPLPFLWRSLGPRDVAWMAGVARDERARIVHLHTFASQVVGTRAALRVGARVLRTEHSTRAYVDPSCWPFSRWSLARADACVAISEYVRAVATARAPWAAAKVHVVPNGVDVEHFAPREEPKPEAFTFVLVARLERRKGVDLALEALARVPGAHLDVIGDGDQRRALEDAARARGVGHRVRFHGFVADTRGTLSRAHAALCTSREEGLGIALIEAMSTGLPVVGFAVGGVPELVEEGKTGLLCRPGDVEALAVAMRGAMEARAKLARMGAAARDRVTTRFSVQAMCAGYAEAYARLSSDEGSRQAP
jgi:glycosyltransferase involved in cell wall biosynthesis